MPGLDRSGPMGAGPMTGGRKGLCGSKRDAATMPGYHGGGFGYGRGMGNRHSFGACQGRGRGAGRFFGQGTVPAAYGSGYAMSKVDEMSVLRTDAEVMKNSLEAIQRRIDELEKEATQ